MHSHMICIMKDHILTNLISLIFEIYIRNFGYTTNWFNFALSHCTCVHVVVGSQICALSDCDI